MYAVVIVILLVLLYIVYNRAAKLRDDTITGMWIGTDAFADIVGLETMAIKFGKQLDWRGNRNAYILFTSNPGQPQIVYDGLVKVRIDYGLGNIFTGGNSFLHIDDSESESSNKFTDAFPSLYELEIDYTLGRMRWFAQQDGERTLLFEAIKTGV